MTTNNFVATIDLGVHFSTLQNMASAKEKSAEKTVAQLTLQAAELVPTTIIRLTDLMDVTPIDIRQLDEPWHDLAYKLATMN